VFGHPYAVILFPPLCVLCVALAVDMNVQTYLLSVIAISSTQMVLVGNLTDREEDKRRDIAMHGKLDELILAVNGARDEMTHLEELSAEEIERVRR
jgi:low affinity Fe/Cu permease